MNLQKLINKLEKIRNSYLKKHGVEPEIFSVDSEEGFLLCSKVEKPSSGLRVAERPYATVKTGLEKLL